MADDDPLLARARAGDAGAVASLLVRNLPMIEAYVRLHAGARVRQKEGSSDLVQSVCAQVLAGLDGFEFRGEGQFRHWLCQQALHKIINKHEFYGAQKRDVRREQPPADAAASGAAAASLLQAYGSVATPSRVVAGREAIAQFEAAFDALPEDYRQAITMQRLLGLDYADIAAAMGRSEGAVRNLVYRGLARLSAQLDRPAG